MDQAMQDLAQQIQGNQKGFQNMLAAAIQEARETKEDLKSLASGMQAGSWNIELKKMPLRHQLELAEHLKNHKKLKEIAQWAGRFTKIARSKQKAKHRESIERSGSREAHLDDEFINKFNEAKERKKFNVMGVLNGSVNEKNKKR